VNVDKTELTNRLNLGKWIITVIYNFTIHGVTVTYSVNDSAIWEIYCVAVMSQTCAYYEFSDFRISKFTSNMAAWFYA